MIEIEVESRRLRIEFPYNKKIVDVVRSLPSRWFDRDTKAWYVPLDVAHETVGMLARHDFCVSVGLVEFFDAQGVTLEEVVRDMRRSHKPFISDDLMPPGTWTVDKLNHEVQEIIREAFREEVWLAAEIQGFDRSRRRSGHAFFELIHRPYQGGDPSAKIPAVMWAEDRARIERALDEDGGEVRLRDGLIVRFLVRVDFYTGQGRYQVSVSDIDLAYTTGTIHQNREAILRELDADGILEKNREMGWPMVPLRIGLITSDESDAFADFVHELERSGFGFDVTLCPAQVQGARTEPSVLRALGQLARHAHAFDAVAIIRGGGARSDLAYFDTEAIGRAICTHPLKVIVGVGHQRDTCLLDFVAHSEKTPTAAAQFFVQQVRHFVERRTQLKERILEEVRDKLSYASDDMRVVGEHALRVIGRRVEHAERQIERHTFGVSEGARARIATAERRWERLARGIPSLASRRIDVASLTLEYASQAITSARLARTFDQRASHVERSRERLVRVAQGKIASQKARIEREEERLELLDPRRVLERGFALVRRGAGEVVREMHEVKEGEVVQITLARGSIEAQVTQGGEEG